MKITKHVYFYPCTGESLTRSSNAVVIVGNNKQVMIDPGVNIQNRLNNLIIDMKKDGLDIDKTSEMWLTHAHIDHFSMIYNLFKRFKEQRLVRCHPVGEPILSDPKLKKTFISQEAKRILKYLSLKDRKKISLGTIQTTWGMAKKEILNLWQKTTVTNIESFSDEEIVDIYPIKVQIIFLPGHVPDEIGFWIPKEKVLILGDLICISQYRNNEMRYKLVLNTSRSDLAQALESLQRMKQIKEKTKKFLVFSATNIAEILLTPHSAPVRSKENIRQILDQLISKIDAHKAIVKEFIRKHPDLAGIKLIRELAEKIPDDILDTEKRFIAEAFLRSLYLGG